MTRLLPFVLLCLALAAALPAQEPPKPDPKDRAEEPAGTKPDLSAFVKRQYPGLDPAGEHDFTRLKNYTDGAKRFEYTRAMARLLIFYIKKCATSCRRAAGGPTRRTRPPARARRQEQERESRRRGAWFPPTRRQDSRDRGSPRTRRPGARRAGATVGGGSLGTGGPGARPRARCGTRAAPGRPNPCGASRLRRHIPEKISYLVGA